jgi:hypothetical protein
MTTPVKMLNAQKGPSLCGKAQRLGYTLMLFVAHPFR